MANSEWWKCPRSPRVRCCHSERSEESAFAAATVLDLAERIVKQIPRRSAARNGSSREWRCGGSEQGDFPPTTVALAEGRGIFGRVSRVPRRPVGPKICANLESVA